MTPDVANRHVALINKGLLLTDTNCIDIGMPGARPVWESFARGMQVKGMTQWHNPEQKFDFRVADFPVIHSNHYYTLNDPEVFAGMLIEDYEDFKRPWFVIIYCANCHMTPYKAKMLMDYLPANRFKASLMDEFFTAARLARKKIEDKVWRSGFDAPKGVAP